MKVFLVLIVLLCKPLVSFYYQPWLPDFAEVNFATTPSLSYFPSVNNGINPNHFSATTYRIQCNLSSQFLPMFEGQVESDFFKSRKKNWLLERFGVMIRKSIYDDVVGDPLSMAVGVKSYFIPTKSLKDVTVPYLSQGNMELNISLGKEIDTIYNWDYRFWSYCGLGFCNKKTFYINPEIHIEAMLGKFQKLHLSFDSSIGFGDSKQVNINHFNGYAKIAYRSIDIDLEYAYLLRIWGMLSAKVSRRVLGINFPENETKLQLSYILPFSVV